MKVAALDLGSNTFLCLICEVVDGQITQIYSDDVEVVRLGQDVNKTKRLHPEALARAQKTLTHFKKTIDLHKPDAVLAMATSAARDSENKEELFKICSDLQIPLEIIPGHKEAQITFEGSISGLTTTNSNQLIVDIGGGSTEYILGQNRAILISQSLNIGCVRLTEQFVKQQPTQEKQIQELTQFIHQQIVDFKNKTQLTINEILAVAGTPTTLAAVEIGYFDPQKIDGYIIARSSLEKWLERLTQTSVEQKLAMGFPAGRADVILVGIIILLETLKIFNMDKLFVSTRGVRFGIALEVARRH